MQGVRVTAYAKRKALKMWKEEKVPYQKVCSKFKVNLQTLYRWLKRYDGTLESLENRSSRPLTPHPNAHTEQETQEIIKLFKKNPDISYNEAWGILRHKFAYNRSFGGFYNFVIRNNIRPHEEIKRYTPQPYDTPEMLGYKWQMDVKYVPIICYKGQIIYDDDNKFFQYTMIDEATRERFLYAYKEHNVSSTLDFVKRAIAYFGYAPSIIQTDNGLEFTNHKEKKYKDGKTITTKKEHALDTLLNKLGIKHQLIRAYTPRLNGKVERSHRSDQEAFYNHLTFKTLSELKNKMMKWNIRYNNRPHSRIKDRNGKKVFWTPLEKRADLLALLNEKKNEFEKIRFTKTQRTIKQVYAA